MYRHDHWTLIELTTIITHNAVLNLRFPYLFAPNMTAIEMVFKLRKIAIICTSNTKN